MYILFVGQLIDLKFVEKLKMKHFNKDIKSSNLDATPRKCKNCVIIRIFLLSVLFIILLGLIKSDQLHYLKIVTGQNAAIVIIALGCFMFVVKLVKYLIEKK